MFQSLHPAEIWQMREDVAIDILAANAALMDRIHDAPDDPQSRSSRGGPEQRITSMESLTSLFAGAKGAK